MPRPEIVMEIGAGHGGQYVIAVELIEFAAAAGVDWVKLQTFDPDRMVLDSGYTIKHGPWRGRNLHKLYAETMTPWAWHKPLFDRALELHVPIFSTPFSVEDLALLESIDCPRYKIASFDILDLDLIEACAATQKPLIISTGMASTEEIIQAIDVAKFGGCRNITILACVSDYPAEASQYDLRRIIHLSTQYSVKWGVSDHTEDNVLSVAATAMGASMIERHIGIGVGHEDDRFALDAGSYRVFVNSVRVASALLYDRRLPGPTERQGHEELRKSLYFATDLPVGATIMQYHLRACRPACGIPANQLDMIIGNTMKIPGQANTPVSWDHVIEED